MKSINSNAIFTREEKVKTLLDGIKFKIPFKLGNNFEKFIMILSSSGVGKISIIIKFLNKEDTPLLSHISTGKAEQFNDYLVEYKN